MHLALGGGSQQGKPDSNINKAAKMPTSFTNLFKKASDKPASTGEKAAPAASGQDGDKGKKRKRHKSDKGISFVHKRKKLHSNVLVWLLTKYVM